jgi:hypothetical protein
MAYRSFRHSSEVARMRLLDKQALLTALVTRRLADIDQAQRPSAALLFFPGQAQGFSWVYGPVRSPAGADLGLRAS